MRAWLVAGAMALAVFLAGCASPSSPAVRSGVVAPPARRLPAANCVARNDNMTSDSRQTTEGAILLTAARVEEPADDEEPPFPVLRFAQVERATREQQQRPDWTASSTSTERRPIHTLQVNAGQERILVLASLHGNEPLAVELTRRLAEEVRDRHNSRSGPSVLFVRSPNPDGMARKTRINARGVDLNRNFPTANFRPDPRWRTGVSAGSELETRFVLRLFYAFRPQRVVHLKSTTDANGWVLHNQKTATVAARIGEAAGFKTHSLPAGAIVGSLETYVTDVMGLEHITIAVPAADDADRAWERYRDVLFAAMGAADDRAPESTLPPEQPGDLDGPLIPSPVEHLSPEEEAAIADWERHGVPKRGYFELPPPPEDLASGSR